VNLTLFIFDDILQNEMWHSVCDGTLIYYMLFTCWENEVLQCGLLKLYENMHCCRWWCRISYPCWWRILCIQLFGMIMMFSWH